MTEKESPKTSRRTLPPKPIFESELEPVPRFTGYTNADGMWVNHVAEHHRAAPLGKKLPWVGGLEKDAGHALSDE